MHGFNNYKWRLLGAGILVAALIAGAFWVPDLWRWLKHGYGVLLDRQAMKSLIEGFDREAPFVFIGLQILQVIFAPVPGEASGFLGGYLFGTVKGFFYSTIGLTAGSWIAFLIGRYLGDHYVRKLIPADRLSRLDGFIKHQGVILLMILFILPGFPKDYLCLFLGATALPLVVFMVISTLGRMPGTLMLSIQGASVYDGNYLLFAIVTIPSLIAAFLAWHWRERIYRWVDHFNHRGR